MPYPRKLLNDHETVALDLHPHWWFFAKPAAALFGSIVLGIFALTVDGDAGNAFKVFSIGLIIVTGLWTVHRYLSWATTNFVITSDRVIFRSGLIAKHGIEIPLERVNNVSFSKGIIERMIGAGDLLIESGGEDGKQRFTDIRGPERVQNLIHAQIELNKTHRAPLPPQQAPVIDVVSQLEKLEGMVERGTLSREEFDAQKRKLLG